MRGEGIVPVMEVGNNNNGGFGGFGNSQDWAWIIILFLIFGFGNGNRGGFGNYGGSSGVADNYILATDMAQLDNKIDRVNQGLCDGFYTTAQQIYGLQNTLCQGFNGLNVAFLQGNYALSSQLADCCCKTQRAIDSVNFNNAQNTCAITNAIAMNTRDILENANANYRAIHEELVANKLEAKNDRIAEQQNEINALRLKASQEAQNNYLLSELKPYPSAAYIVPNPNCCYQYQVTQCNPCGCNNY